MKPSLLLLAAATATAALSACGAPPPQPAVPAPPTDDLVRAAIGQTVGVGGPRVTPLALLEDSRCPMNARCVWAGRVRVSVRIDLGSGSEVRELTQGEPVPVADGALELVEVQPDKPGTRDEQAIPTEAYRLGFRFQGGL